MDEISAGRPTTAPGLDAQVIAAAARGDRVAFGRVYDAFSPMVHGVLLARVARSEVDDLAQEVFLQAMRRLSSLRDLAAFGPWIAAIARNRARDHHRRGVPMTDVPDDLPDGSHHERDALDVLAVIRRLPEAYRETLVLRLVEGMTGPEIAARTGMTHGSVRVNLHRGMAMLRAALQPLPSRAATGQALTHTRSRS